MKRLYIVVILVFTGLISAVAQDIITYKSGKELKARIIRLNTNDITCIPEGVKDTISLLRQEVSKLYYKTGIVIYLSDMETPELNDEPVNDSLYFLGESDAIRYYRGYKTAAVGTLVSSLFVPFGLIPAIACSASPPLSESLGFRDQKLMENASYYRGYSDKAFKIKKKKVWKNFAIGTGITVGYYAVLIILVSTLMVY